MTRKTAPSCRRKIRDAVKFSMLAAAISFPLFQIRNYIIVCIIQILFLQGECA